MKKKIKGLIKKTYNYNYHESHKTSAMKALRQIEEERGTTNPENLRLAKEYAKDVLGSEKYAPWLYVYTAVAGEFKKGWIPDNYYDRVVNPKIKGEYGKLDNRNLTTNLLLKIENSLDICYYVNNLFWTSNFNVLDEEDINDLLFHSNKNIVYKVEKSGQGKGVYFFNKESFRLTDIKKLGDGVFQNYINQHSFFSEFTKSSVATIRITSTCDDNGEILVNSAYLRVGRNKDTHVKSASALKIPININNGQLSEFGYFPNWKTTDSHPDSKVIFKNKILPSFQNCITEVLRMHDLIPFVRCIGWDIIVDEFNNVRLIEWNGTHNDIKFSEATQGPCFKDLQWEQLR